MKSHCEKNYPFREAKVPEEDSTTWLTIMRVLEASSDDISESLKVIESFLSETTKVRDAEL